MGLNAAILVGGAPDDELSGAALVEVHERIGETTTYRVRLDVSIEDGDLPRLADARLDPGSILSVLVPSGGANACLVKGPVHGERIHLVHGGGSSWVDVIGSDRSVEMDRTVKDAVWKQGTASDVVKSILGTYAMTPDVEATKGTFDEKKHVLVQHDSDLRLIRRLARRSGFLFWITADETGVETAHFKRPPLEGAPAAEINVNAEPAALAQLDIAWDVERPTSAVARQLDLNNLKTMDGAVAKSPLQSLGATPFVDVAKGTRALHLAAPVDVAGDLTARGEGAVIDASWFVRAWLETSVNALGTPLRAHTVVDLQGVGKRHSGKWFVAGVRHLIDAQAHRMEVELVRNGWGS